MRLDSVRRPAADGDAGLPAEDYRVDEDIAAARTLPAAAFQDGGFLARELGTIFSKTWLLVPQRGAVELREDPRALGDMLRVRGARVPFSLLDRPLFLQRGWKDERLRCFPNVCTHAWYPLVPGPGRSQTLVCAQHGRQFDCAGRFLYQPGFKDVPDCPSESDHLRSFPVDAWESLLFTCLGEPLGGLDRFLGEMKASAARLHTGDFKRMPMDCEFREVDGNWKQHAWNYMDRFHIAFIHKAPGGLADAVEMSSYRTELYEYSSLQWVYAKNPAHGFDPKLLPARFSDRKDPAKRVFALWWFVFPNMTFNFYPWGLSVNVYMPVPYRPDRTFFAWYAYVMDARKFKQRDAIWLSGQVDREDVDAISQAARGARSGFAPRGRFAPKEESGPHWFHRLVSKTVLPT